MKNKKSLKKFELTKEKVSALTATEAAKIQGGQQDLLHSHVLCTQSKADAGCTASTKCASGGGTITIVCI